MKNLKTSYKYNLNYEIDFYILKKKTKTNKKIF